MEQTTKMDESLGTFRLFLEGCKSNPELIPQEEWKALVRTFRRLIDDGGLPFDTSLIPFCQNLVENYAEEVDIICGECEYSDDCSYKEEKRADYFNSFNLGLLYGIALSRLLFDRECI